MTRLNLHSFQKLIGLPDSALLWLLKNNKLDCELSQNGELLIDPSSSGTEKLVEALKEVTKESLDQHNPLLVDKIGEVISEQLEVILQEALE